MSKKINYYGTVLTDKYYILPGSDDLSLPVIKTPVVICDESEIVDWTFSTQRDAYIESRGCVKCGSDTLTSTLSTKLTIAHWRCVICGHCWETYRGIFIKPKPKQMVLFEVVE